MSKAEIVSSSKLLEQAKAETDSIESRIAPALFHALLPIADKLARAKEAYERETGTGHGMRNPQGHPPFRIVAAKTLERSESFVERLVQLSRLDEQTRELVAANAKLTGNQDALLSLAREPSVDRRRLAVEAFGIGGRAALDRALDHLIDPVDVESVDQGAVAGFLTSYTEAKAALAEAREAERAQGQPKSLERRRENAKVVFDYLSSGERKIDDAARKRMGISRAACKRALDDLRGSQIVKSAGDLDDTFEISDDRGLTQLVLEPRRSRLIVTLVPGEKAVQKLPAGRYEITVAIDVTTAQITLRRVATEQRRPRSQS